MIFFNSKTVGTTPNDPDRVVQLNKFLTIERPPCYVHTMNIEYSSPADIDQYRFLQALSKRADYDLRIRLDRSGHLVSPWDWSILLLRKLPQKDIYKTSRNARLAKFYENFLKNTALRKYQIRVCTKSNSGQRTLSMEHTAGSI